MLKISRRYILWRKWGVSNLTGRISLERGGAFSCARGIGRKANAMIKGPATERKQQLATRNHPKTIYSSKIGRVRCRSTGHHAGRTKTRERWHGHKLYSNKKLHIGDLKQYHMRRANKVPSTILNNSTCYYKKTKCHLENSKKERGTISILYSVYYIIKRCHLN